MSKQYRKKQNSAGFTIVELMIATMVFSVILVSISIGVMYFTRSYYKGVYESTTQNVARDIANHIASAIKFSPSTNGITQPINDDSLGRTYFCAGGYIFVYQIGQVYTGSGTTGLYMQPFDGSCSGIPASSNQRQLLNKNMRIAYLSLDPASADSDARYTISVTVAYGADDLFNGVTSGKDIACASGTGSEYCAVTTVTATASPRIAN